MMMMMMMMMPIIYGRKDWSDTFILLYVIFDEGGWAL